MHQVHTYVLYHGINRTWCQVCAVRHASISGHTGSHTICLLQPSSHMHSRPMMKVRVFLLKVPSLRMYPEPAAIVTVWCSQSCEVEASRRVTRSAVDPDP